MNLLEATVLEVIGTPYQAYGKWFLIVIADCYGRQFETRIMVDTEEEANNIQVGYTWLT